MSDNNLIETIALFELKSWMKFDPDNRTQTFIAEKTNVSQPAVSNWINGKTRPEHLPRLLLEIITKGKVKTEYWLTKEEREVLKSVKEETEERKVG